MQEKKISEKESLKLIMTMIDQTKTDDGRHSGDTMLIWGYLTTLLGLGIYGLTLATNTPQWNLLWLSLPFVGFLSFCSVGVSVSGLISQERLLTYLPFLPFCLGLHLLVQLSRGGIYYNSNLWFALGFVVLMIIPGHYLNHKYAK